MHFCRPEHWALMLFSWPILVQWKCIHFIQQLHVHFRVFCASWMNWVGTSTPAHRNSTSCARFIVKVHKTVICSSGETGLRDTQRTQWNASMGTQCGSSRKRVCCSGETRSSAQGNCSAKSLAASVLSWILPCSSILPCPPCLPLVILSRGVAGGGEGGLAGGRGGGRGRGRGQGHFSPAAIHCTTTRCFALKGLRTMSYRQRTH